MKQASSKGKAKKMRKMMERSKKYRLYNDQNFIRKIFKSVHEPLGNSIRLLIVGGAAMNPKIIEDFSGTRFSDDTGVRYERECADNSCKPR